MLDSTPMRRGAYAIVGALVLAVVSASALAACTAITSFTGLAGNDVSTLDATIDATRDASHADGGGVADGSAADASSDGATSSFPDGSVAFGGHAYMIVISPVPISWDDARARAQDAGGHLATITSASEDTFALGLVSATPAAMDSDGNGPLLGGYQPSPTPQLEPAGGWAWVTGEPWVYTNWGSIQPDNSGGDENYLVYLSGAWNDIADLEDVTSYLIEWEP
jgi:hypothetical protein